MRWLSSSHVLVVSSVMEGGANVICEAARIGVPVLASRIPGNVGMLGRDYPGYFPLFNDKALARLIERCRTDASFYKPSEQSAAKARAVRAGRGTSGVEAIVAEFAGWRVEPVSILATESHGMTRTRARPG